MISIFKLKDYIIIGEEASPKYFIPKHDTESLKEIQDHLIWECLKNEWGDKKEMCGVGFFEDYDYTKKIFRNIEDNIKIHPSLEHLTLTEYFKSLSQDND